MELLKIEKQELDSRYAEARTSSMDSSGTLDSLRAAVAASEEDEAAL